MDTPQMDKLAANHEARVTLIEFLDWIARHPDLALGQWIRVNDRGEPRVDPLLVPCGYSADFVIYEFLEIDYVELERERRALLETLRPALGADKEG
jgi:hypothetical protein